MAFQVQGGSGSGAAALYMYRGPVQAIQTIVAKEGWRTFYKGYATVAQVAPAQALYFGTYQAIKRYLPGTNLDLLNRSQNTECLMFPSTCYWFFRVTFANCFEFTVLFVHKQSGFNVR